MKARAEGETHRRGLDDRELKRGRGGIRDIEFAVQLLQLVHGRHDPTIRSGNTLDRARPARHRRLREPTGRGAVRRRLPVPSHRRAPPPALGRAADAHAARRPHRAAPGWRACSATATTARGRRSSSSTRTTAPIRARVRSTHEKLFFGPLLEALAGRPGPLTPGRGGGTAAGLRLPRPRRDARRARRAHPGLQPHVSAAGAAAAAAARVVLRLPDPDLALLQLRRLAEGPARAANLANVFRDSPAAAQRTCRVLGSSRMLGDALRRQPEFVRTLGEDDELAEPKPARARRRRGDRHGEVARRTTPTRGAAGCGATSGASCCASRRATCLSFADLVTTGRDLSTLAEACLEAALVVARAAGAVRGHRHGSVRRARPLVRIGPRRALRLRRRRPGRLPRGRAGRVAAAHRDRRTHARGSHVRDRRHVASRGQAGLADPLARRVTGTTGSGTG